MNITPEEFAEGCKQAMHPEAKPAKVQVPKLPEKPATTFGWSFEKDLPYDPETARRYSEQLLAKKTLSASQVRELLKLQKEIADHTLALRRHDAAKRLHEYLPEFKPWLVQFVGHHLPLKKEGLMASMLAEHESRKASKYGSTLDAWIADLEQSLAQMTPERRAEVWTLVIGFRLGAGSDRRG